MINTVLPALVIACLGAALGSFANVVILRLRSGESLGGRSHCLFCNTILRPKHLVPIFSWFILRGRCATCFKQIHYQYPVVETAMALMALVAWWRHLGDTSPFAWWLIGFELFLAFVSIVIVTFDVRWELVPVDFVAGSVILLAIWRLAMGVSLTTLAIGLAWTVLPLAFLVLVSRGRWMGQGDPWVAGILGVSLSGALAPISLLLAFVIGGVVSAALLLFGGVTRKTRIPFVPFLIAGLFVTMWYAGPIHAYLRFILP
jgi:leader peptidase (prepilin peptidase) / N-methyltransferase